MPAIPAIIANSGRQIAPPNKAIGARVAELRSALRRIWIAEAAAGLELLPPAGRYGFDELAMCSEKLGTGVEREPDAESLLARRAFGSPQLLRDLRCPSFLARHRFQLTELA